MASETLVFNTSSFTRNDVVTLSSLGFSGSFRPVYLDASYEGSGSFYPCRSSLSFSSTYSNFLIPLKNQSGSPVYPSGVVHYTSYNPLSDFSSFSVITSSSSCPVGDFNVTLVLSDSPPEPEECEECQECQECPVIPDNPYDDKLDNITQAIYTCGAILLVIYFFYCIYRMLIKNSGGK